MQKWEDAVRDTEKEAGILEYWFCTCHNNIAFYGCTKEDAEHNRAGYYNV